MQITTEAVLDHFGTPFTASPGAKSSFGLQLTKGEAAGIDSEGKKIVRGDRVHARLVQANRAIYGSLVNVGRAPLPDHDDPDAEGRYGPDGELRQPRREAVVFNEMVVKGRDVPDPVRTTDRMHEELIGRAQTDRVATAFRGRMYLHGVEVDALRVFSARARMREGEVASEVLAAYQRWVHMPASGMRHNPLDKASAKAAASRHDMSPADAAERKTRDRALEARALLEVRSWMVSVAPHHEPAEGEPAQIFADALLALDSFTKEWTKERKRGAKKHDEWMPLTEVARRSGIPLVTLRQQCDRGDLPARKRPSADRQPTWWVNLTACVSACEDPIAANYALTFLMSRIRSSN